ncbi:hypothetical protein [Rossellomorea yichunensis]|jgi:putative peptide zinc metalloprotease protein|uniref:hypothetical protein n=1 Tax=Rossellomorea yichunensis TaxID=3077331 RepID=UPI0028E030FA|nr:hypothetical protein [Rossellomorea sp. YC4-1]MDT9026220.1 hypothetical protein [Rossellomorea sp. YC4-1]
MRKIDVNSKVKANLSIQKDAEEYVVGSTLNNVYIRVPEEAIIVINHLNGSLTIKEVIENIHKEEKLDIDVLDFVNSLNELDLLTEINGKVLHPTFEVKKQNRKLIILSNILFNRITNSLYLLMFLSSLIIFATRSDLIPTYHDILVFDSSGLSLLSVTLLTWLLTFFHESGHFFSTSKLGIPVKFSLSLRMYWLVVQADVSGLWSVSQRERYVPYLAGMAFDAVVLFISLLIRILFPTVIPDFFALLTLLVTLTFGFHCLIFLRTDIYYVIMNAFNIPSLHDYAIDFLKSLIRKSHTSSLYMLSKRENVFVKCYSAIYVLGSIFALFLLAFYSLPSSILIIQNTLYQLIDSQPNSYTFIDGIITLVIILINVGLWLFGAFSKYKSSPVQVKS